MEKRPSLRGFEFYLKKTLLIGLVAMAGVVAQAQQYAYTTYAKVKIVGEELVQNGNFSASDSYESWTGADGATVDPAAWAFIEAIGPEGENVMQAGGTTQEGALVQAVAVEPGTYYVSFQLLGTASNSSKVAFFNTDGSLVATDADRTVINANNFVASEWTTVADTVTVNAEGFIVFSLAKMAAETQVTNFSVKQANVVYDTRALERFAEYANAVVESGYFTSDNGDFAGYLGDLNAYLNGEMTAEDYGTDFDDPSAGAGEMDGLQLALNEYLNENSADLLTDEKPFNGYGDNRKWNSQGSWTGGTSGRWFSGKDGGSRADVNEVVLNYPYNGELPNDQLYYPLVASQTGVYMFKIESMGNYFKAAYDPDILTTFRGARFFMGKNKPVVSDGFAAIEGNQWQANDNNDQVNFHAYTFFLEAQQGDTIYCGSQYINDKTTSKKGGQFRLANPVLRLVSVIQADLDYQNLVNDIKTQQSVLGERIITANEMVTRTKADGFPWGHAALQLAIDTITPVYTESFNVIDADGNVLDESRITEEYRDEVLLNAVNSIKRSWQAFESLNAHYTTLLATIAEANASNENPLNAAGDHETFLAAISKAQALADGITSDETLEGFTPADCDAAIVELKEAQSVFEVNIASFNNPSELIIVDGDFAASSSGTPAGWTFTEAVSGKEQYKRATDASFEGGYRRGVWRGYIVAPTSKLVQTINLVPAGVYEYRAQAYAANEGKNGTGGAQDQGMWKYIYETIGEGNEAYQQVVDTIFNGNSGVRLLFGLEGAPDSTRVKSPYFGHSIAENRTANLYLPQWYSVYYVKTTGEDTPETVEFGMDSYRQADNGNNGANAFGFGSNHLFYLGSYDRCLADIKEDLNTIIRQAKKSLGQYGEDNFRVVAELRLAKAVRYAEEALGTDNLTTIANTRWALLQAMQDYAETASILGLTNSETLTETVTAYSSPSFTVTLSPNGGTAEYFNGYYRLGNGGSLTLRCKSNVESIVSVTMNLQEPSRTGADLTVSAGTLNGNVIENVNDTTVTIIAQGSWPQLWAASLTVTYMGTPPDGTYAIRLPQYQTHGSVTSDMDWADEGDEVTLTATPEEGYHLARLYANRGAVTLTASATASNQYTFTMPAEDVIIGAVFAEGDVTTGVLLNVPEDGETATNAAPIYNLQGQRLTRLQRGVNVVGGKKVLK